LLFLRFVLFCFSEALPRAAYRLDDNVRIHSLMEDLIVKGGVELAGGNEVRARARQVFNKTKQKKDRIFLFFFPLSQEPSFSFSRSRSANELPQLISPRSARGAEALNISAQRKNDNNSNNNNNVSTGMATSPRGSPRGSPRATSKSQMK
jgi:hypothetical protein